jgi:CTP:molybdopterin cytidylyltransferase MocA
MNITTDPAPAPAENVAAILLAAGKSQRMGLCKQLLQLADHPAVAHCLDTLMAAGVKEIVTVVSPSGEEVAAAVSRYPVVVAVNETDSCDMADSVRTGLSRLTSGPTGILVALADHPLVRPATVRALVDLHRGEQDAILIPVHDGAKGHPTLFPAPLLRDIGGTTTLRDVIGRNRDKVRLVPVADEGVVMDMDVWEDYLAVSERLSGPG